MSKIESIFSSTGNISSKRVFGGMGILVILICYVIATINHTTLPSCTEFIFAACVTLLGCDSVVNAISNKKDEQ